MCLGGKGSSRDTRRNHLSLTDSNENRRGNRSKYSNASDPRSTTTRSAAASSVPISATGTATGVSNYSRRPKTSARAGGSNEALPVEFTAKSPTRKGSTESRTKECKGRNNNDGSTKMSYEDDIPTLRNIKESRREAGEAEATDNDDKDQWSEMGKSKTAPGDRKHKPADRRAILRQPSPIRVPPPSIPSRPSPTTTPPPVRPLPSPSHTVPVNGLNEKTAIYTATTATTVCTQRTIMDEDTHKPFESDANSIQVETRMPVVFTPQDDKALQESKKLSILEEKTAARGGDNVKSSTYQIIKPT